MTFSLGIDIGTSGVRTAVVDARRTVVSMVRAAHLPQDPTRIDATLWWQAVHTCLQTQMEALRDLDHDPKDITGISVDGTSGSMVLTDTALQPVGRALMYNSKGFEGEAAQIDQYAPDPHITRGSNSALARAMRLVSDAERTPTHLLHQADFITAKLMGKGGLSDHNNALKTGYDPAIGAWPDWIDQVIDPALLPEVSPVGTVLGQIDPHCADDLGLSHAVRVHAGTTDSIAAFLACAPLEPGTAVTSLGSTLAIKILSKVRIDDPNIGLYSHRIRDMWLVGGASNTGGAVLAEYFTPSKIAKLSTEMDPNAPTGLDYYPLKHPGERFPINDPNLPPRVKPRPESDVDFLQGLFEGIAAIEALCYQEIQARGGESPRKLLTAGGGADNAVFSAIRAHALNVVPQSTQATEAAIGAAYLTLNPN